MNSPWTLARRAARAALGCVEQADERRGPLGRREPRSGVPLRLRPGAQARRPLSRSECRLMPEGPMAYRRTSVLRSSTSAEIWASG